MNTDTPHGADPDPAGAALAALAAAHRSLSAVIDRELPAACGLSLAEAGGLPTLTRPPARRARHPHPRPGWTPAHGRHRRPDVREQERCHPDHRPTRSRRTGRP